MSESQSQGPGSVLRAGVAKSDITTDAKDAAIHDPLFAKALVLDDGATRVVILAMDVVAIGCIFDVGDAFLLGTDLVKDPARLVAAYDDHDGITAAFNLNALSVLNRELDADFDPMSFDHQAYWDDENRWIEMRLVATEAQTVVFRALGDLEGSFEPGEWLRTEISAKFTPDQVVDELWQAGLVVDEQWLDPDGDFALTLAHPYC